MQGVWVVRGMGMHDEAVGGRTSGRHGGIDSRQALQPARSCRISLSSCVRIVPMQYERSVCSLR